MYRETCEEILEFGKEVECNAEKHLRDVPKVVGVFVRETHGHRFHKCASEFINSYGLSPLNPIFCKSSPLPNPDALREAI